MKPVGASVGERERGGEKKRQEGEGAVPGIISTSNSGRISCCSPVLPAERERGQQVREAGSRSEIERQGDRFVETVWPIHCPCKRQ